MYVVHSPGGNIPIGSRRQTGGRLVPCSWLLDYQGLQTLTLRLQNGGHAFLLCMDDGCGHDFVGCWHHHTSNATSTVSTGAAFVTAVVRRD